jgi:hypothetical protein
MVFVVARMALRSASPRTLCRPTATFAGEMEYLQSLENQKMSLSPVPSPSQVDVVLLRQRLVTILLQRTACHAHTDSRTGRTWKPQLERPLSQVFQMSRPQLVDAMHSLLSILEEQRD